MQNKQSTNEQQSSKQSHENGSNKFVTVIYYDNDSLELKSQMTELQVDNSGTIIIPKEFSKNKSIVVVCEGEVNFLNTIGDRSDPLKFTA